SARAGRRTAGNPGRGSACRGTRRTAAAGPAPGGRPAARLRGPQSPLILKCLASSACGRGMTCTETSSPTLDAVSAPASVAAFTAPTSPTIVTDTSPSPTCSRPTIVTFAALTMASADASAATYPLVSINPIALSAITHSPFLGFCRPPGCRGTTGLRGLRDRVNGTYDER